MFNALRHRNFRLYLSEQFVSFVGTWMQQLATSWMVYRMTDSALWLGISTFSSLIPTFLFGLFAGVLVDRWNHQKIMIITQSLAAVQSLTLALLTLSGHITLTELIGLNLFLGTVTCFDNATRQAFVVRMLDDKKDLPNAIALNSSVMNSTRLIGPAIGGRAIGLIGEGYCFLLNFVSYLAVLIALLLMKVPVKQKIVDNSKSLVQDLKAGFQSAFGDHSIRSLLLFVPFMSLFGIPYNTIFPLLVKKVGEGHAEALGYMTGAAAAGSLVAGMGLAKRKGPPELGKLMAGASVAFSVFVILLSFGQSYWQLLPCIFITGMSIIFMLASGNTVIQYLVKDEMRGRVMSFFTFTLMGVVPFGSLLLGAVAQKIGTGPALIFNGSVCLVGSLLFSRQAGQINAQVAAHISHEYPLKPLC